MNLKLWKSKTVLSEGQVWGEVMQSTTSYDFHVAKFLVTVGRIGVADLADCVDRARDEEVTVIASLLRAQYIAAQELTVARDAVRQVAQKGLSLGVAKSAFQLATQKGITFGEAVDEVNAPSAKPVIRTISEPAVNVRLGELLVLAKFINKDQLERILGLSVWQDVFIGQLMVQANLITDKLLENSLEVQKLIRTGQLNVEQGIFVLHYAQNAGITPQSTAEKFGLLTAALKRA